MAIPVPSAASVVRPSSCLNTTLAVGAEIAGGKKLALAQKFSAV
jgi:hypothetical protein